MKKWLIASQFAIIPIFLFGIVNPLIGITANPNNEILNSWRFYIYLGILLISITIVTVTTFGMVSYTSKIDKLDKLEDELNSKKRKLNKLIEKYNDLISNENKIS